jgi:hypothetical protein
VGDAAGWGWRGLEQGQGRATGKSEKGPPELNPSGPAHEPGSSEVQRRKGHEGWKEEERMKEGGVSRERTPASALPGAHPTRAGAEGCVQ